MAKHEHLSQNRHGMVPPPPKTHMGVLSPCVCVCVCVCVRVCVRCFTPRGGRFHAQWLDQGGNLVPSAQHNVWSELAT